MPAWRWRVPKEAAVLDFAAETARMAGRLLADRLSGPQSVREKGPRDLVTDADVASQSLIVERLQTRFPDHAIWGEEGEQPASLQGPLWVVDPLDGTTNYAHRIPLFGVALALAEDGVVRLGVAYDPLRDHLFAAERGKGAWLNGQRLRVSQTDTLAQAVINCDWGRSPQARRGVTQTTSLLAADVMTLRSMGSSVLAMCYVAAGWLDAYFNFSLMPWDLLAPALCIEEAGGRVTGLSGQPWGLASREAVCSNGRVHEALLATVQRAGA
ncbi:MAG: inositol monophosphatase [Anaerolineae bacterium]|nr:inositol monophosphatase [Anaerolineae bacterium]